MAAEQQRMGSTLVLRLTGSIGDTDREFDDVLTRLVRESEADIIVDLSAVGDFRALRSLRQAERLRRDQGAMHRLAIVAPDESPIAARLIMNGMRKAIPIFGSVEDVRAAWETDGFPA